MASIRTPRLRTNVENTVRQSYNDPVVIGALVGSLFIVSWADYKRGNFPPSPKKFLALLAVYGILGVVTVSENRLGRSFAVLIFIGLLIKELPTIQGKSTPVVSKTQALAAQAELTQAGGGGFDFPQANPNPLAPNPKHKITKKTGKGTHTQ